MLPLHTTLPVLLLFYVSIMVLYYQLKVSVFERQQHATRQPLFRRIAISNFTQLSNLFIICNKYIKKTITSQPPWCFFILCKNNPNKSYTFFSVLSHLISGSHIKSGKCHSHLISSCVRHTDGIDERTLHVTRLWRTLISNHPNHFLHK